MEYNPTPSTVEVPEWMTAHAGKLGYVEETGGKLIIGYLAPALIGERPVMTLSNLLGGRVVFYDLDEAAVLQRVRFLGISSNPLILPQGYGQGST